MNYLASFRNLTKFYRDVSFPDQKLSRDLILESGIPFLAYVEHKGILLHYWINPIELINSFYSSRTSLSF